MRLLALECSDAKMFIFGAAVTSGLPDKTGRTSSDLQIIISSGNFFYF